MRKREGVETAIHVADWKKAVDKLVRRLGRSANPAQTRAAATLSE